MAGIDITTLTTQELENRALFPVSVRSTMLAEHPMDGVVFLISVIVSQVAPIRILSQMVKILVDTLETHNRDRQTQRDTYTQRETEMELNVR